MTQHPGIFDRLVTRNNVKGGEWLFLSIASIFAAIFLGILLFSGHYYLIFSAAAVFYLISSLVLSHFLYWGYRKKEGLEFQTLRFPRFLYVFLYFLALLPLGWLISRVGPDIDLFLLTFIFISIFYSLLVDLLRCRNRYSKQPLNALFRGFLWPLPYSIWLFFFSVLLSLKGAGS